MSYGWRKNLQLLMIDLLLDKNLATCADIFAG
jgi:hypothetical protein